MAKSALVCGAGGFIGGHLVQRLKHDGLWVRGVDLKFHEFSQTQADDFVVGDLRDQGFCRGIVDRRFDEVYQLAADMGGAGYIFTGEHDADLMHNSATINLNVLDACYKRQIKKIFYSSSACMYPAYNQGDPLNPQCAENSAYPAAPDSEYGWEKLFSERMCRHFSEDFGLRTKVARFHNVYGPFGTWDGGREKAPAAICRKVIAAKLSGTHEIEIWGDGHQTRSFMYIDDCIEGIDRIVDSNIREPINLGSSEMVSINQLVDIVEDIGGIKLKRVYNLGAPKGVNGRNSDNALIRKYLGWEPGISLRRGLETTYAWIFDQMKADSRHALGAAQ